MLWSFGSERKKKKVYIFVDSRMDICFASRQPFSQQDESPYQFISESVDHGWVPLHIYSFWAIVKIFNHQSTLIIM